MPHKESVIKILQSIICDDVRMESNGKFLLIGVYSDGILMNPIPGNLIITLWLDSIIEIKSNKVIEFEIKGDALSKPTNFKLELNEKEMFDKAVKMPMILKTQISVANQGNIDFKYRLEGDNRWNQIKSIGIKKSEKPIV